MAASRSKTAVWHISSQKIDSELLHISTGGREAVNECEHMRKLSPRLGMCPPSREILFVNQRLDNVLIVEHAKVVVRGQDVSRSARSRSS